MAILWYWAAWFRPTRRGAGTIHLFADEQLADRWTTRKATSRCGRQVPKSWEHILIRRFPVGSKEARLCKQCAAWAAKHEAGTEENPPIPMRQPLRP